MFESRDSRLWKDLYADLVRQHLEYAVKAWNPKGEHSQERPTEGYNNPNWSSEI